MLLDEEQPHLEANEAQVEHSEPMLRLQVEDSSVVKPDVESQPADRELQKAGMSEPRRGARPCLSVSDNLWKPNASTEYCRKCIIKNDSIEAEDD